MHRLSMFLLAVGLVACGDDGAPATPDARPDGPPAPDAPPDAPPSSYTKPEAKPVVISAGTADALQSASPGPGGTFYAAGFRAATLGGTRNVVLVKLTAAGALDTTFNTTGIVETPLVTPGGNGDIVVATASDGKIVIAATLVGDPTPRTRTSASCATTRTARSTPGSGPTARCASTSARSTWRAASRSTAPTGSTSRPCRAARATRWAPNPRTDTDFTVARVTAAGALDATYGTAGKFSLDIYAAGTHTSATARALHVAADNTVIAGGYATVPGVGNGQNPQAVVYKLTAAGALDPTFGTGGYFNEGVLQLQTEVYNLAIHGTHFITGGYGRETGTANQYVFMRFATATGVRDTAWGGAGAINGAVLIDPSSGLAGSNLRNVIALPGGKTLFVGSANFDGASGSNAIIGVIDAQGALDTETFGDALFSYELDGADAFWGAAVSGTNAIAVGFKGRVGDETAANNDDSYVAVIPLPQ